MKYLWPRRDRLHQIELISWEPFIPWELVRLSDPENGDVDDKFLAEYGLIRKLSGKSPPQKLKLNNWSYLAAEYPLLSHQPIGAEVDYFKNNLPNQYSIQPHPIAPDAFIDAIRQSDFDVLHISCNGKSEHNRIEDSVLIIGDRPDENGNPEDIALSPSDIGFELAGNFAKRRHLVFLNGCETGQLGGLLTTWGGWPKVFVEKGAGVFVGTSWPVRDKPAALFAQVFYDSLLGGQTLVQAAGEARLQTKALGEKMGDASWLAFKVYGQPLARKG